MKADAPGIAAGRRRVFLGLLRRLRPHWREDRSLPERIEAALRRDRRLGARDRRLQRELIYAVLRHLPWIEPLLDSDPDRAAERAAWLAPSGAETDGFRQALVPDWPPCPESTAGRADFLGRRADELLPEWLRAECPEAFSPAERDALCSRAPLWLRLQTDRPEEVFREFEERGWTWEIRPPVPRAVRLPHLAALSSTAAYRSGRVEIQDIGSQMILESAGIEPGGRWLDACAGAGGKTLQLAFLLGEKGRVDAFDVRRGALREMAARAVRAGLMASATAESPGDRIRLPPALADSYDGVLVDAPCSGSGTWRRQPHLKWSTSAASLPSFARRQLALLGEFSRRVAPGGRLLYATCSLCRRENEAVAGNFLAAHPGFVPEPPPRLLAGEPRPPSGLRFFAARTGGDAFYLAAFRRR